MHVFKEAEYVQTTSLMRLRELQTLAEIAREKNLIIVPKRIASGFIFISYSLSGCVTMSTTKMLPRKLGYFLNSTDNNLFVGQG